MAGVSEGYWGWSHKGTAKALSAILRYEIPEAWPLWAVCSELRQRESAILKTVLQSKGRLRLVTVPGFGLMVLSYERSPSPDVDRDRHGRKSDKGHRRKRRREDESVRGPPGPRPRDPYENSE